MNLSPAKSQKAEDRPISFILDARGGDADEVTLFIRPEEMSRNHPSRTSVNQTLGGAWIDSFGEGLESTTLSGTLGWRTGPDGQDGGDRLIEMREKTYHQWHKLRQEAVDRGDDPNDVKLRFVDALNSYSSVIVPLAFEIRRNKSRPLLASYRISFISVGKAGVPGAISGLFGGLGGLFGGAQGLGLDSLFSSLGEINSAINKARNFVDKTILGPVTDFMRLSSSVFTSVHSTIQNGLSLADPFVLVARNLAQTGMNVFRTMAAVTSIPSQVKAELMQVAGAYSNAFCVLHNALKKTPTYEDYNPLYGASNCSSTSGGSPPSVYAGQNPFYAISPSSGGGVGVSPVASAAMYKLSHQDVVLAPLPLPVIGATLSEVNNGVAV
jgi:hypothetical protein